jgi:zinc protease
MESTKENFRQAIVLLKDILRQPSFPSNEFEKQKQQFLTSIDAQKSEPQSIAFNKLEKLTNNYDPSDFRYPQSFDEQTADVNKIKLEDVKKFYTDFYNSTNATVVVVGDFEKQFLLDDLNTIFQNWNAPEKYVFAPNRYYDAPVKSEKINTPDKANAMLAASLNLELKDDNPDFPALLMGNFILGGGFLNSRLSTRIRQKEGISYGVGSWLQAGELDNSGVFGSYAIYNPGNSDKLVAAYKEELNRFLKDGITEEELKDAKSGFLQSRSLNRSEDDYLLNKLTKFLNQKRTMKWDEEQEKVISNLTASQINTTMNKWLKADKITIVQAGDFDKKK